MTSDVVPPLSIPPGLRSQSTDYPTHSSSDIPSISHHRIFPRVWRSQTQVNSAATDEPVWVAWAGEPRASLRQSGDEMIVRLWPALTAQTTLMSALVPTSIRLHNHRHRKVPEQHLLNVKKGRSVLSTSFLLKLIGEIVELIFFFDVCLLDKYIYVFCIPSIFSTQMYFYVYGCQKAFHCYTKSLDISLSGCE